MKKTQTIVDREQLSSDYIESKQDFGHVLSQVKLLPTANWKSPWFYGPIGIAVLSVAVSIVSFNPSNAIASTSEMPIKESKQVIEASKLENQNFQLNEEDLDVITEIDNKEVNKQIKNAEKSTNETFDRSELALVKVYEGDTKKEEVDNIVSNTNPIIEENKIPLNNKFPYIDGYFTGEIPLESLFNRKGILFNESVQVVSFDLNFFTGRSNVVNQINGNKIPEEMRSMIINFNIGKTIFITNIKAYDRNGRMYTLPSMNLIPVLNE